MSSHQFKVRAHTGGYNRSVGLEKEERDPSKKSDDFNCTGGPVEEDITFLMLQIREGAADTEEEGCCHHISPSMRR